MSTSKVFRNQETSFFSTIPGALGVFSAIMALATEELVIGLPIAIASLAIGGWIMVRWRGQGVYVDDAGVRVRGTFIDKRIAWDQISRFELRDSWNGLSAHVDFADGSSVPARALNAGSGVLPSMKRRAQEQVDELNRLVVERRGQMPPPPPERTGPKRLWEYLGLRIAVQGPLLGIAYASISEGMRVPMLIYGVVSVVGGLIWFFMEKRKEE